MELSELDWNTIRAFRQLLHQYPELSGQEVQTTQRILDFLKEYPPDQMIRPAGKSGLMLVYDSGKEGPTVVIRGDIDALPIQEKGDNRGHISAMPGVAHLCGHDGHTAMVATLGMIYGRKRPAKGRLVLLFQPAEETGKGARAIVQDPQLQALKPDYFFGLHNIPGVPAGTVILKPGTFCAASVGMEIQINGTTSHAAEPEKGNSPVRALSELMVALQELPDVGGYKDFVLVTVVHALMGEAAYGINPGHAELRATLRAYQDADLELMKYRAETLINRITSRYNLNYAIRYHDEFPASENHPQAYTILEEVAKSTAFDLQYLPKGYRWSEDFGHYNTLAPSAFFGLGAGEDQAELHNQYYDFPDTILSAGVEMFYQIAERIFTT